MHLQSSFKGDWKVTYDQAGVMIRASNEKWIKAGIEYVDGVAYLRYLLLSLYSPLSTLPRDVNLHNFHSFLIFVKRLLR